MQALLVRLCMDFAHKVGSRVRVWLRDGTLLQPGKQTSSAPLCGRDFLISIGPVLKVEPPVRYSVAGSVSPFFPTTHVNWQGMVQAAAGNLPGQLHQPESSPWGSSAVLRQPFWSQLATSWQTLFKRFQTLFSHLTLEPVFQFQKPAFVWFSVENLVCSTAWFLPAEAQEEPLILWLFSIFLVWNQRAEAEKWGEMLTWI